MDETYDVVVVGGGAAGLSAGVTLARARRSVLVVEAGTPRNAPAGHVHNYLGREGTPPGELLAIGRAELTGYGGHVVDGTVTTVTRLAEPGVGAGVRAGSGDGAGPGSGPGPGPGPGVGFGFGFRVELGDGRAVVARRLLVATGLRDELPDVPGLAARWGRDVLHCPYCHGWEVRDQAIGVLATGPLAVHQALLFRQLSADVTLFTHTAPPPRAEELARLAARGIAVVAGEVAALEVVDDRLAGVRLTTGEVVARQAVVVQPRFTARAEPLAGLGIEPVEQQLDGHVIGTFVPADATGATDVPGVWVAGNVADLRAQVGAAAAAGVAVAAMVNVDLVAEDTRLAVAGHTPPASGEASVGQAAPASAASAFDEVAAGHAASACDGHGRAASGGASHGHAAPVDGEASGGHAAPEFDEVSWERRYRDAPVAVWSGRPNPQLVAETADLRPGTALDAGSGEGGDALWLAARGWRVTGVDFARTALRRAAEHADSLGAEVARRVRWVHADLTEWVPPERFDLVSAHFMHLPSEPRRAVFDRLAAAVAPGGTLLLVGHHPDDIPTVGRPQLPDLFFTAEQLADSLDPDAWEVLTVATRPRPGGDHEGHEHTVRDTVLRARRRT